MLERLTVTPQFTRGVSGSTGGLTVSVANPNSFPLTLSTFTLTLPKGVSIVPGSNTGNLAAPVVQGGVLTWNRTAPLGRGQTLVDHVVLRVGKISSGLVSAQLKATPPDGTPLDVSSKAALRFVAHPKRVTLNANGQRGTLGLHGTVTSRLRLVGASGSLILNLAPQKSVTLRARSATVQRFGTETLLTMPIVVGKSTGVTGCAKGAVGVLHVVDWDALTASLRTHDRLSLKLPASCGGVKTFVDASARQPLTVKLDFA